MFIIKQLTLIFLSSIAFFQASYSYSENEDEIIEKEINSIIQLAVNLPKLQQYFHNKKQPLSIKLPNELKTISLMYIKKFNMPIHLRTTSDADLIVSNWVTMSSGINFDMSYYKEGVLISYKFKKKNMVWVITQFELVER